MENRKGTRLIDRPEFNNKPKPITFLKTDKVYKAISIMSEKNYGSVVITILLVLAYLFLNRFHYTNL